MGPDLFQQGSATPLTLMEPWQCASFGKPYTLLLALLQTPVLLCSCAWSAFTEARRRQQISMGELVAQLWLETRRLDSQFCDLTTKSRFSLLRSKAAEALYTLAGWGRASQPPHSALPSLNPSTVDGREDFSDSVLRSLQGVPTVWWSAIVQIGLRISALGEQQLTQTSSSINSTPPARYAHHQ